jgi:hypothetical protein
MACMCVSLRHHYNRGERVFESCGSKTRTMRPNTREMPGNMREIPGTYLTVPPRKQNHMLTSQYATCCYEESMLRGFS